MAASQQHVLVTGGTGYVGSHVAVALLEHGHRVTLADNLSNSKKDVVDRIAEICKVRPDFVELDIRDARALATTFQAGDIHAVVHCAGLKSGTESIEKPRSYYDVNVSGTLTLLAAMEAAAATTIIFSSSATVYGQPGALPISEDAPTRPVSPYGRTKLMVEQILADLQRSDATWQVACLRYFNPVGAHESGRLGEDPLGTPNSLVPLVAQVASGTRPHLDVFGTAYETPDGTAIRDYIHVMDLAVGHVAALERMSTSGGCLTLNLGTGRGYSVLEIIRAFEKASGRRVPWTPAPRRAGDVAECWADVSLAFDMLGWRAVRPLTAMIEDAWRWYMSS